MSNISADSSDPSPPTDRFVTPPHWSLSRFDMIPFVPRDGEGKWLVTPGGYWVEASIVESTYWTYWRYAKKLSEQSTYTAERFSRDPDWEDRDTGEKLKIGRCFKYFSDHGILPIVVVDANTYPTHRYRLTTDGKPAVSDNLNPLSPDASCK